jgi:hypothetical protein
MKKPAMFAEMLNLKPIKLMKNLRFISLVLGTMLLSAFTTFAQSPPSLKPVIAADGAVMFQVSDNGLWASGHNQNDMESTGASIWNLNTSERIRLTSEGEFAAAWDVTDDGKTVVGSYNSTPAFWQDGIWTQLPIPIENGIGEVTSVTPDGTKMVGRVYKADFSAANACVWENGELVTVTLPSEDRFGDNAYFNEMVDISADGNTVLGCLNYTVLPNRTGFFIKDGNYVEFGTDQYEITPEGTYVYLFDVLSMSPNGKWITGDVMYIAEEWVNEYFCPFRYDVENDVTELFVDGVEVASFASDDDGNLFGVNPLNDANREAVFVKNGEWVSLDQELMMEHGINVMDETGYEKLGNLLSVSADGRTIVGVSGMETYNWVLKLDGDITGINDASAELNRMKAVVKHNKLLIGGKVVHFAVYNTLGNEVMNQQVSGVAIADVSHLTAGVYIVSMTDVHNNTTSNKVWIGNR